MSAVRNHFDLSMADAKGGSGYSMRCKCNECVRLPIHSLPLKGIDDRFEGRAKRKAFFPLFLSLSVSFRLIYSTFTLEKAKHTHCQREGEIGDKDGREKGSN